MKKSNYVFIILIFIVVAIIIFIIIKNNTETKQDKIVVHIDPRNPVIALTFDDGPNRKYTEKILELLHRNDCVATFFISGMNISGNEDILRAIVNEGSELSNHTYDHLDLTILNNEAIKSEIQGTQELVNSVLGDYKLLYVRPPYGSYNEAVLQAIDYPIALWSFDSGDWEATNSKAIYEYVISTVKDGDSIIMHDTSANTYKALIKIIPYLKKRGFQFVTLSELYQYRGEIPQPHEIYR